MPILLIQEDSPFTNRFNELNRVSFSPNTKRVPVESISCDHHVYHSSLSGAQRFTIDLRHRHVIFRVR